MSFELTQIPEFNNELVNDYFLNGSKSNSLVEHMEKISLPAVDVQSYEWYFEGIRMSYSDWHFKEAVDLRWNYNINIELVTFMVNLKGSVWIAIPGGQQIPLMGNYQHNLFYSKTGTSDYGIIKREGSSASMFFLQFTKDAFLRLTENANEAISRFSDDVVGGRETALSPSNLTLEAPMRNMIDNILHCQYKDGLKKMYLLSKSIEFLVIQAEACNNLSAGSKDYRISKLDRDCLMHAREYIIGNLESPPSLSELARIIGMNEYKLKRGFKETFGNTVFGYLSDARLEIAKNNLLETSKPVTEIAFELGYSSVQHFSSAFSKKFGLSPSKLRN
jgi:AraC family transcriptional regulator, transcriptional activator of the genes for pyochelin and ferripyochelin receptors